MAALMFRWTAVVACVTVVGYSTTAGSVAAPGASIVPILGPSVIVTSGLAETARLPVEVPVAADMAAPSQEMPSTLTASLAPADLAPAADSEPLAAEPRETSAELAPSQPADRTEPAVVPRPVARPTTPASRTSDATPTRRVAMRAKANVVRVADEGDNSRPTRIFSGSMPIVIGAFR